MGVEYDNTGQQILQINIELKPEVGEDDKLRSKIQKTIVEKLLKESSEYRETQVMYGEKVYPEVVFWPYEDPTYFKPGTKQKWIKK